MEDFYFLVDKITDIEEMTKRALDHKKNSLDLLFEKPVMSSRLAREMLDSIQRSARIHRNPSIKKVGSTVGFQKLAGLQKKADSDAQEIARLQTFVAGLGEVDEWDDGTVIMGEYLSATEGGSGQAPQVWVKHGRYWHFRSTEYNYETLLDNLSDRSIVQVSVVTEWSVVYPPATPE